MLDNSGVGVREDDVQPRDLDSAHLVRLYDGDAELTAAVTEFVRAGIAARERVIVIATEPRLDAFHSSLCTAGIDAESARATRALEWVDAKALLSSFLRGSLPDPESFASSITRLLDQDGDQTARPVRIYGELVDVLWESGNLPAALVLEDLWSQLQQSRRFKLFSAYDRSRFGSEPGTLQRRSDEQHALERVRAPTHSGVFSADADQFGALADEVARHKAVERALSKALRELQSSEEALRLEARQLEVITDALPVLVSYIDRERRYRFANRAYETWFSRKRSEFVGAHVRDALGAQAFERIAGHLDAALAGKFTTFRDRIPYADGGSRQIEASYVPHLDAQGTVQGLVALVADVSEREELERAREAAARRAERLVKITGAIADAVTPEQVIEAVVDQVASALEASSAALWLIDEEQTARLVRAVGYSEKALRAFDGVPLDISRGFPALDCIRLGAPVWLASQRELLARYPHLAPAVTKGRSYRISCLPIVSQGVTLGAVAFTFDRAPPFDDDERNFLRLVARYTAQALERLRLTGLERQVRTSAEASAARLEEARLRAELLYEMAEGVIRAEDVETVFTAALDAIERALGSERSAILTFDAQGVLRFRAFRGLSPEYRQAVEGHSPWPRHARAPEPVLVGDVAQEPSLERFAELFERERIAALGFIPLVARGVLIGKFMVYYPAAHELSKSELALARAIANHVAAAVDRFSTLDELQRTVRFNELFTGILGHDLRNPLAAILTAAEVAAGEEGGARLEKPLSRIKNSGTRMARMIDQLLDFTRVRVGSGIPITRTAVDLTQIVRHVTDELEIGKSEAAVSVEVSGSDAQGTWDADRLAQVFSNLIANALHHGDREHGVRVRIDGSGANLVRVEVHNRGVIDSERLNRLFEPMAGGERRDKSQGLGLGLYISHEIVRAHGGRLDVSSDVTDGTRFTLVLPRSFDDES